MCWSRLGSGIDSTSVRLHFNVKNEQGGTAPVELVSESVGRLVAPKFHAELTRLKADGCSTREIRDGEKVVGVFLGEIGEDINLSDQDPRLSGTATFKRFDKAHDVDISIIPVILK